MTVLLLITMAVTGGLAHADNGRFNAEAMEMITKAANRVPYDGRVGGVVHLQLDGTVGIIHPFVPVPFDACSSTQECTDETDSMCADAGHEGSDAATTEISTDEFGDQVCSSDCSDGSGAVAVVICRR